MKKLFLMLAFAAGAMTANAQSVDTLPSTGDYYQGLTRPLTFDRMIAPYALEVTFAKTVHILFPSAIRYVDLGSDDLLAAKADGTDNVLRVKSAVRGFDTESNLSVITEDGSYFSFNVKYADEPVKLSIEMSADNYRPDNTLPAYLPELGETSPRMVQRIMHAIHKNDRREIKGIRSKRFGTELSLADICTHEGLLFFQLSLSNETNIPYDVDFINFRIVDKKVAKRTAIQERVVEPLRAYNDVMTIDGQSAERMVFALPKFTIPDGKRLVVELAEKDGGRHHTLKVNNSEMMKARTIEKLK